MKSSRSTTSKEDTTFEYDNIEEIEQKFEQMSENFRNQQQKQANMIPQTSLINSILKKKGPTLGQQVQSISQLSALKNYFLNSCQSKLSMIEKLQTARANNEKQNLTNQIRKLTRKSNSIISGEHRLNDGKDQQLSSYTSIQNVTPIKGIRTQGSFDNANEMNTSKNRKNLTFHSGQNQQENGNSKKQQDLNSNNKTPRQRQVSNMETSILQTPRVYTKRSQKSTHEFDSAAASTDVNTPIYNKQKGLMSSQRQLSYQNFSSSVIKEARDQTPNKRQQSQNQILTPTLKGEASPLLNTLRIKADSINQQKNQFTPQKMRSDKKGENQNNVLDQQQKKQMNTMKKVNIFESQKDSRTTKQSEQLIEISFSQDKPKQFQSQPSLEYSELLQYKEQIRKENRLCEAIGADLANFAISALLLIQNRDKKECESHDITSKFLSAFGINIKALESMKKPQEKREYVIKQIIGQLKDQYQQWYQKYEVREKEIYKSEMQQKAKVEEQVEREKEQKDQFRWLKVNTFYDELENNLKRMIAMKINNFYNQNFLLDKIISKKDGQKNKEDQQKDDNQLFNDKENLLTEIELQTINNIYITSVIEEDTSNLDNTLKSQNQLSSRNRLQTLNNDSNQEDIDEIRISQQGRKRGQHLESNKNIMLESNNQNQVEMKDRIVDGVSNKLLFIQINQNEQIKSSNSLNFKGSNGMVDALNSKFENNESQQKPLQNLYDKMKPISQNSIKPMERSQSAHGVRGKFNPESLRQNYNQSLNKYISQKQSEKKGIKKIKQNQIVKLQEQIENQLKLGQTISENEKETEYRWLKDNMIQGLSKQDYLDRQQRVLYDNYYWNQVI